MGAVRRPALAAGRPVRLEKISLYMSGSCSTPLQWFETVGISTDVGHGRSRFAAVSAAAAAMPVRLSRIVSPLLRIGAGCYVIRSALAVGHVSDRTTLEKLPVFKNSRR